MNELRLTLPPRFVLDCFECDVDVGEPVHETRSSITIDATPEQRAELRSRARHYAEGGLDAVDRGLIMSARATLKRLDEIEGEARAAAEIEERAKAGGVADLEALAERRPLTLIERPFTRLDRVDVYFRPDWASDRFEYRHNGVRIERERAVELIGERG